MLKREGHSGEADLPGGVGEGGVPVLFFISQFGSASSSSSRSSADHGEPYSSSATSKLNGELR